MDGEDQIFLEADSRPVWKYLNNLLLQALEQGFNEISIQSVRGQLKVTGNNKKLASPDAEVSRGVILRLKIMADMDVSEIMLEQTGKIELTVQGRPVTLAVRTLPNFFEGESVMVTLSCG